MYNKKPYKASFLSTVEEDIMPYATERIEDALLMECNVFVAYPEKLWPAILDICKRYHARANMVEI